MKLGPVAFLGNVVSGAFAAAGAAAGSQLPEFVQQYLQRLGGHRDEAWRFLEGLIRAGTPFDNPVRVAAEQRFLALDRSLAEITANHGVARVVAFVESADWDIARAASQVFRPAVPLTPEGLVFAFAGLVLGVLAFHLGAGTCKGALGLGKLAFRGKAAKFE